jgi:hypothetical protein
MADLFPAFRRFVPPVKSPPLEAIAADPPTVPVTPLVSPPVPVPTPAERFTLAATPTPAVAPPIAPPIATRPESHPGSKPTPATATAAPAVPVHEVGRDRLQVFAPVCERCLSSVYLERRYSDGSESLTCVCCGAAVDGEPKPGLTAERRAKREAERAKMAGRFADSE